MTKIVTLGPFRPLKGPPKLIKSGNFQKLYFFLFSFVILSLLAKNYAHQKQFLSNIIFFLHSFVILSLHTRILCLCPQVCLLCLKGAEMQNFKKSLEVLPNDVIKALGKTCSTYRIITKNKVENTRKWPKKCPERTKNQNLCSKEYYAKKLGP